MAELSKWMSVSGSMLAAGGNIYGGREEKKNADEEAAQLRQRAGSRRAESQRMAAEERRATRFAKSRAQAVLASQGANMGDPSLVNYFGDLEAEGEYNALSRLYEGNEEALGLEAAATTRRREGRAARTAGYLKGLTSAMYGVETLNSKYGR